MVNIIYYENLSWPEVAALPRDIPLALPLGEGFTSEAIADALEGQDFCLLPALPYGWSGSVLPVSEDRPVVPENPTVVISMGASEVPAATR